MFIKTIKVKKPTFAVIGAVLAALALLAVIIVTVVRISSPAVYEMKSEGQRQAFLRCMKSIISFRSSRALTWRTIKGKPLRCIHML